MKFFKKSAVKFEPEYLIIFFIFSLIIIVALDPYKYVSSTYYGLSVWATTVLPGLIVFFFLTKMLTSMNKLRNITKPFGFITRKLFNCSALSGYIYSMSIISGYPLGAKLTSELYKNNLITRTEAHRITAFCSTSGPMFILGSVGAVMLGNAALGMIIFLSHILSTIPNGILYRKYAPSSSGLSNKLSVKSKECPSNPKINEFTSGQSPVKSEIFNGKQNPEKAPQSGSGACNLINRHENQAKLGQNPQLNAQIDNTQKISAPRTFSNINNTTGNQNISQINKNLLTESMTNTVMSCLMVGGFIAFSFVIIDICLNLNILSPFIYIINLIFAPLGLSPGTAISSGILEMTRGCLEVSALGASPLIAAALATGLISFGGLSIHLQSLAFLKDCSIKYRYFLLVKTTQAVFAVIISLILGALFL